MNTYRRAFFRRVLLCVTGGLAAKLIPQSGENIRLLSDGAYAPTGKITPEVEARLKAYWEANFDGGRYFKGKIACSDCLDYEISDDEIIKSFHVPRYR